MRVNAVGLVTKVLVLIIVFGCQPHAFGQYFADPSDTPLANISARFPTHDFTLGPYAHIVADPSAVDGKAVAVTAGTGRDSHMFTGGWMPVKTDAAYQVAFRMRMATIDINIAKQAHILYVGTEGQAGTFHMPSPVRLEVIHRTVKDDPSTQSVVQWYYVDAPSPEAIKDYHDYVVKFERPVTGYIGFRAYWYGRAFASVWIDQVKVSETPLPSEAEELKGVTLDGPMTIDHSHPRTLVCTGPFNWTYRIPNVIGGACDLVTKDKIGDGWGADGRVEPLPDSAIALSHDDVILLSEARMGDYTPKQRLALSEYVKAGGGLVILGGFAGYGHGRIHQSPLMMDLLPVTTIGLWDLMKSPGNGMVLTPGTPRLQSLSWSDAPRVLYYHKVVVKPDAQVWATGKYGGQNVPLVVERPYGKGTVIAFLGTEIGDSQPGQTAVWAWRDWGPFLTILTNAARGLEDNNGDEAPQWSDPVVQTIAPEPAPEMPAPVAPAPAVVADRFEITRVHTIKLVYRPGEWATGIVTIANGTSSAVTGHLSISTIKDMTTSQALLQKDVSLNAGASVDVPVVWKIGDDESFGRELHADLTDSSGAVIDSKGDVFTIGNNTYRLGQGTVWGGGWSWEYGDTMPNVTPTALWNDIANIRARGITTVETFAWAPDDFGNLSPTEDHWFAGQAQSDGLIYRANIHAANDAAHANGISTVTYGKNVMSITGLQVSRDGAELTRMHPEWAQWDVGGEPKWLWSANRYRYTFDQAREYAQTHGRAFEWFSVGVNSGEPDAVRWGADEFVRSAKMFGWDGIRWDDHLTLESTWDGGINFDGDVMDRGGDFEAMSAKNNQTFIDIARAYNPNVLLGYNYAATYDSRGIRYPEAFAVTCKDGQAVMEEWSGWFPASLDTWGAIGDKLNEEVSRIGGLGGITYMFDTQTKNPNRDDVRRWMTALYFASQCHYYNLPEIETATRYSRFMIRYGGLLYGADTLPLQDASSAFKVETSTPCLWKSLGHERNLGQNQKQISLSLLNIDPASSVEKAAMPPSPVANATVGLTVAKGWKVNGVWVLDPDSKISCVSVPFALKAGEAQVSLTNIACWNLVVFDLTRV